MPLPPQRSPDQAVPEVQRWLEQVVIGLNLCPFAAVPHRDGRIRIVATAAATETELVADLQRELRRLEQTPAESLETTLLVVTHQLADFDDYNQFLDVADELLAREDWEGVFQVASFHPDYQFADTQPEDAGNLTNRAPWPILHLLREASVTAALDDYPDPGEIPERNIQKMEELDPAERQELFPWINSPEPG